MLPFGTIAPTASSLRIGPNVVCLAGHHGVHSFTESMEWSMFQNVGIRTRVGEENNITCIFLKFQLSIVKVE